jgi:hypothetical protein
MAALDSDKVRKMLQDRLGWKEETGKDHYYYNLEDGGVCRDRELGVTLILAQEQGYVHLQWKREMR